MTSLRQKKHLPWVLIWVGAGAAGASLASTLAIFCIVQNQGDKLTAQS